MSGRLEGKAAVVTGAGSGIGRSIAEAFHREGAAVVLGDISGAQEDVAAALGERAVAVHADVTSDADVQAMIKSATSEFGRLDIVCNNAGIEGDWAPIADCTPENFDRVVAVHLRGVYLGMHHAIPAMLDGGGGSIINIASVAGMVAIPNLGAYCAAKAGIIGLSRVVAVEYGRRGIRVNALCPGFTDTPRMQNQDPALVEMATAQISLGRLAESSEMASVAVFLASDESSYVTGLTMPVDGGYTSL